LGPVLTKFDFISRNWQYRRTHDFYYYNSGTGTTIFENGSAYATAVRLALGLRLIPLTNGNNVDIMVALEQPNYYNNPQSMLHAPLVYILQYWPHSVGKINIEFSPKYPVAGVPLYSNEQLFKPYFSINLLLNISRFKLYDIDFNYEESSENNYGSRRIISGRRGEISGYLGFSKIKNTFSGMTIPATGLQLKYKKVIHTGNRQNYIDFQMNSTSIFSSAVNEFNDAELTRILNFSPDLRFTKRINRTWYFGAILGLNSLTIRNSIPYYNASFRFDSQNYFLSGSIGGSVGILYSKKKAIAFNYYYMPSLTGKGSQELTELELSFKAIYVNLSLLKIPEFKVGYINNKHYNAISIGCGVRMNW
jgi:hypothetical protein